MLSLLRCKLAFFSVEVMTKQYDNQEQHQHQSRLSAIKELYKTNKQTISTSQSYFCHHSTVLTSQSPLWKADDTAPARHREEGTASQVRQAFVGLPHFPANVFISKLCHVHKLVKESER